MKANELLLPCLKGVMGDWTYFTVVMPFKEVARRISFPKEIYTNTKLSDMIQRTLDEKRGGRITEYLLTRSDHFFGSLVVGAYGGKPTWYGLDSLTSRDRDLDNIPQSTADAIGFIRLSGDEKLFALDGQHRLAGIREALEKSKELASEDLTVILVAHRDSKEGIKRTRKLFISLNKHAVKVGKKDIIALDEIDNCAIITRKRVNPYIPGHSSSKSPA